MCWNQWLFVHQDHWLIQQRSVTNHLWWSPSIISSSKCRKTSSKVVHSGLLCIWTIDFESGFLKWLERILINTFALNGTNIKVKMFSSCTPVEQLLTRRWLLPLVLSEINGKTWNKVREHSRIKLINFPSYPIANIPTMSGTTCVLPKLHFLGTNCLYTTFHGWCQSLRKLGC